MLVLMCHAGASRYAVDSASVIEVVPCVQFDSVADSPEWLAGVFAHRGAATPLVDFTLLLTGQPCPRRWNSRIILARFEAEDMPSRIGLLAERVTTAEIDEQAKAAPTDPSSAVESLGPILLDDRGMFQLVDLSRLVSGERRSAIQPALSEGTS
jgi:chemotaxis-related protein WspB